MAWVGSELPRSIAMKMQPDAEKISRRGSVFVVILNWNGMAETLACLESLMLTKHPLVHFAVVDNGSVDGSAVAIRARFPQVTLLETGANLGYSGGNNAGIRHFLEKRDEEFVLVLNNDTVVDPNCISALVDAAEALPTTGIFGPKIYFFDRPQIIWFASGNWSRKASIFLHVGGNAEDRGEYAASHETEFVTGCAMFVRRAVFEQIGLFDERLFLMFEDSDFCYRARARGWQCAYVAQSKLWHKISVAFGGPSSPVASYFYFRNRLLFAEWHLSLHERLNVWCVTIIELLVPSLSSNENLDESPFRKVYWSIVRRRWWGFRSYRTPAHRARIDAVTDYICRRFGGNARTQRVFAKGIGR